MQENVTTIQLHRADTVLKLVLFFFVLWDACYHAVLRRIPLSVAWCHTLQDRYMSLKIVETFSFFIWSDNSLEY